MSFLFLSFFFFLCLTRVRLVLSNGFENALVLCLNCFLVKFGIPLHLFDLGLECIFWLWET